MSLIKIQNVAKGKLGGAYASTATGEVYTFSNPAVANDAKPGAYAWGITTTRNKRYKLGEDGKRITSSDGSFQLEDVAPYQVNQITAVFADAAAGFRAKNEAKLMQIQEKAFMKGELAQYASELTEDELASLVAIA